MKKILFLIPTLRTGGAEKVLVDLVNALPKNKYEITLQTVIDDGPNKNRVLNHIKYKTIITNPGTLLAKIKTVLLYKILSPRFIYNQYIKGDYDIEVAFLEGIATKLIAHSTSAKSKKIAWVHTDLINMFGSNNVYKNLEENANCYEKFDRIACVSDMVKHSFISRFGELSNDVKTIYNLIPSKEILVKGKENIGVYNHDFPILVSCGRFTKEKGFDRLLRIHKRLLDEGMKHYLWLIGDGILREEFEKYIEENELTKTVRLFGYQDNPYKYISKADLFVCSSISEGYSIVISEAVVLGVPVISTNVAGALEPIEHPRCYKVVDNNEESLYIELESILKNPTRMKTAKDFTMINTKYLNEEIQLQNIINFIGG